MVKLKALARFKDGKGEKDPIRKKDEVFEVSEVRANVLMTALRPNGKPYVERITTGKEDKTDVKE